MSLNGMRSSPLRRADLHYWSPELQIRVDQDDDHEDGAEVRCLVGPRQSVWAMFAFFYALVGLITFFGGFYGLVQEDMGESSDFIWCLPVGILLLIGIWVAAKVGQNTGRDQMLHLVSVPLPWTQRERGSRAGVLKKSLFSGIGIMLSKSDFWNIN